MGHIAGERDAFGILYTRYLDRIRAVVGRFVREPADAEDLAQDVFVRALRSLPRFRGDCKFSTWLHQIAINTGINFRQRRTERSNQEVLEPATEIGPAHLWSAGNREQETLSAIGALPPPMRQALYLNVVRGFDYAGP